MVTLHLSKLKWAGHGQIPAKHYNDSFCTQKQRIPRRWKEIKKVNMITKAIATLHLQENFKLSGDILESQKIVIL